MKNLLRYLLLLLYSVLLFSIMSYSAFAHPGNTDSSGGHTDHSTGDYHYHHGYSAHEHYDMDGDGIIDCPYDFNDRTNSGGNRSTNDDTDTRNYRITPTSPPVTKEPPTDIKSEEELSVPIWVYFVFIVQAILISCMWLSLKWKSDEMHDMEGQHRKEISSLQDKYSKQIDDITKKLNHAESWMIEYKTRCSDFEANMELRAHEFAEKQLQHKDNHIRMLQAENSRRLLEVSRVDQRILKIAQIKLKTYDIEFDGEFPVRGHVSKNAPFGDFTVYIATRGKCYHYDQFCGGTFLRPTHILTAKKRLSPCSKCVSLIKQKPLKHMSK